jgi:alpha-beta hydrolase superfamily lysophospholipase
VTAARRFTWRFDVSDALELPGAHEIAVDAVVPVDAAAASRRPLLCCLPGGSLSRRYHDLEVDGDRAYSFAEFMAARGFASVALDHVGTGESSRLENGAVLDPDAIARANQSALDQALARLRVGGAAPGLPPLAAPRAIGVGHSMGSCLTVVQQAGFAPHAALVLFSFTTRGLPQFLTDAEKRFADDPDGARANLAALVQARFGTPTPGAPRGEGSDSAFGVGTAPEAARRALRAATTNLAAGPGLLSMIPGAYAREAAAVRVPVFLAVGDHDLHGPEHASAEFPAAPEVLVYVLPDAWHCHHVANTRERLWARVAAWIGAVASDPAELG